MTSAQCEPAVEVVDVVKEFPGAAVRALDHATLTVTRGEWLAITGSSGSGKSTLLHLIAALDRPTSGRLRVMGQDLRELRDDDGYRRNAVGLVFQLHNLLAHLDAVQNIEIAMMGTHRRARARRARALDLLSEVQLLDKALRKPPELSGGERQRLALARALANEPALVLADEPTGSLDPLAVRQTLDLFARLRADHGVTVLMVTHDTDVARAADRIVQLEGGRFVEQPTHGTLASGTRR